MKNPWVIVGILTVVLFGGAIWYSNVASKQSNEGITVTDHISGDLNATVTLTEYSDFQCPACGAFYPVLKEVLDKYGTKIRFEYKHYPLPMHPFAQQAALAAEAAGQQGKFFEMADKLFTNQKEWTESQTPQAAFLKYADELGLDKAKFSKQMKSSVLRDHIKTNQDEAGKLGLTSTPTFFLNGQKMELSSYEGFIAQITAAVDPTAAAALPASSTVPAVGDTNIPGVKFGI
jgi:protein-disulfide isomerase